MRSTRLAKLVACPRKQIWKLRFLQSSKQKCRIFIFACFFCQLVTTMGHWGQATLRTRLVKQTNKGSVLSPTGGGREWEDSGGLPAPSWRWSMGSTLSAAWLTWWNVKIHILVRNPHFFSGVGWWADACLCLPQLGWSWSWKINKDLHFLYKNMFSNTRICFQRLSSTSVLNVCPQRLSSTSVLKVWSIEVLVF